MRTPSIAVDPCEAPKPAGTLERILLVERCRISRLLLAGMLTKGGYDVIVADSAAEAVEAEAREKREIHLLLASIDRGEELAMKFQVQRPSLRILLTNHLEHGGMLLLNEGWMHFRPPAVEGLLLKHIRISLDGPPCTYRVLEEHFATPARL